MTPAPYSRDDANHDAAGILAETINYGGTPTPRGLVLADLQRIAKERGLDPAVADRLLQGYDLAARPDGGGVPMTSARSFAARKGAAKRRGDWDQYLSMQGHHECLMAFVRIADEIASDADYWRLLSETWSRNEAPGTDAALWRALLTADRPGREAMMTTGERAALDAMPDLLTVYRGAGHPDYADGFAWTLDRDKAVFFANYAERAFGRSTSGGGFVGGDPVLSIGEMRRDAVLAYLAEREESEVLVLPGAVDIQTVEPLPDTGGEAS